MFISTLVRCGSTNRHAHEASFASNRALLDLGIEIDSQRRERTRHLIDAK